MLGITHLTPNRAKNMFHRLNAALQWRNRWSLTSASCSHMTHLEQNCHSLSVKLHVLNKPFYKPTNKSKLPLGGIWSSGLIFKAKCPPLLCNFHLGLSGLIEKAGCELSTPNRLATSPISQSFSALLKQGPIPADSKLGIQRHSFAYSKCKDVKRSF